MKNQAKSESLEKYYQNCAFPKPKVKKEKKKVNGFKDKENRICHYCGRPYAQRHEIWGGPWRQTSIDMGFQVDVCPEHHAELQANSSEWAQEENRRWQIYYQLTYEEKLIKSGISSVQARSCWMHLIGNNYLHEL